MGWYNLLKKVIFQQTFVDLLSMCIVLVGIFIILYIYYENLIFILLAIISFIFIFYHFFNQYFYKTQEELKEEESKNPKEFAFGQLFLKIVIILAFVFILVLEIIKLLTHPITGYMDYISLAITLFIGIIIFALMFKLSKKK